MLVMCVCLSSRFNDMVPESMPSPKRKFHLVKPLIFNGELLGRLLFFFGNMCAYLLFPSTLFFFGRGMGVRLLDDINPNEVARSWLRDQDFAHAAAFAEPGRFSA